jgi:hypothetical protein
MELYSTLQIPNKVIAVVRLNASRGINFVSNLNSPIGNRLPRGTHEFKLSFSHIISGDIHTIQHIRNAFELYFGA